MVERKPDPYICTCFANGVNKFALLVHMVRDLLCKYFPFPGLKFNDPQITAQYILTYIHTVTPL